ncbi:MAG: CoB--CoM heterodisulfide reductase iron-sulfur subunit A family protein [Deltaproteobacteria bacterium]|nr:CoB--CoM heterodisulfide reductase iron-sulfur subunit A family protein [Deltaproteobacteria bacterium]
MVEEKITQTILVVGGGISGVTTAIEAAEAGYQVVLVEKNPYLGGRVAQLNQYFPKLCPPYCGLEINFKRMKNNSNIRFFTMAEVESISGQEGNFDVAVKIRPRYVNEKCTACGKCAEACSMEIPNPFDYDLGKIKAAYLPHDLAFPMRFVLDPALASSPEGETVKTACPYDAIDLTMSPKSFTLNVGAIVWATGWSPFDAGQVEYYNYNKCSNVITNVMMERLAAKNGPTGGKIVRPSDGKLVMNVAFVQCAGSRDENFQPYCSGVCCLASLKQSTYVRAQDPAAKATICFIDIRAMERLEDFYVKVKGDENVTFIKSKIAKITQNPNTGDVTLEGEDTGAGKPFKMVVDMAVLATGMVPNTAKCPIPAAVNYDAYGFVPGDSGVPGIYTAGTVKRPNDVSACVQSATAAAVKAIQSVSRR